MGKRKDDSFDADGDSPHKKHKKHKKHKHKRRREVDGSDEGDLDITDPLEEQLSPVMPAIKLKLKIGGQTLGTKSVTKGELGLKQVTDASDPSSAASISTKQESIKWQEVKSDIFKTKKPGDDTSDEEKEWLDALEKGELDDMGGIKKDKDPLLLTARQRALLHGKAEESLLELPSGYRTPGGGQELTDEQLHKRQQKAKKRKEQAQQKAEKDKKQTLDRLLKKQESRIKGGSGKGKSRRAQTPGFRYLNKANGVTISVPQGFQFPFKAQTKSLVPQVVNCGIAGCNNPKKYSCSKTGLPLCSLECYKKNMTAQQRSM